MPVLIGVFVGAPLLARELESGTFRFTWTQAVGRRRQVLVTLALLALIIAVGSCLLGLLMDSYAHPFEVIGQENHWISRLFEDSPAVLAAWSVFALTVGICAGAVVGRTVAAMAASATVLGAAAVFSYQLVHWLLSFAPTVISHGAPTSNVGVLNSPPLPGFGRSNTWLVRAWLTGPRGAELTEQQSLDLMNRTTTAGAFPSGTSAGRGPEKWLSAHHYVFSLAYQPAGHYWIFQGVELVALLVLAATFTVATTWIVNRRSA